MAKESPPQDLMHYDAMVHDALRGVVKAALKRAASPGGLPGEHHFYITFKTDAPGVSGRPTTFWPRYPDEMTIVLQHQYWDLAPGETFFVVTLKFGGEPKKLSVPYAALTRFYDPSVQFLLTFETSPDGRPARGRPSTALQAQGRRHRQGAGRRGRGAQGRFAGSVPQEMKEAFADVPLELTDEAILQRFASSKRMPPWHHPRLSPPIGQSGRWAEVEVEFDARPETRSSTAMEV